jgi:branched-subunit amino acid transport protein
MNSTALTDLQTLWLIIGMVLVTFAARYLPFALATRDKLWGKYQELADTALSFVPVAVLTSIIVPTVLIRESGIVSFALANFHLWSALVAMSVSLVSRNILLTVISGLGTFALLKICF